MAGPHAWGRDGEGEGARQQRRGPGEQLILMGFSQPWGLELDLAVNRSWQSPKIRGTPGRSMFSRAAGLQQGRRECSRVFLEAGGLGIAPASLQLCAGEPSVWLPQWSSNQAANEGLRPGKVCRGPGTAHFGGMEQLAAAPNGSQHFLWARLQTPPWWAGRGVSCSGCLFIGHCLKCQVHLDALNTCMSH